MHAASAAERCHDCKTTTHSAPEQGNPTEATIRTSRETLTPCSAHTLWILLVAAHRQLADSMPQSHTHCNLLRSFLATLSATCDQSDKNCLILPPNDSASMTRTGNTPWEGFSVPRAQQHTVLRCATIWGPPRPRQTPHQPIS